ncbi:MAG TPA: HPF/RaiA family ribosome-associated protein [Actinomycetota bacterium]|nr:HPF/RaiA family ribosome-associated protein [Actinomycetota bacterium]
MDLHVTARGTRLTDQARRLAEHKLARLSRMEPRATRIEVEVLAEHNPRLNGTVRIEAALDVPRKTFRARGDGPTIDVALDVVAERLERQIRDHHGKRRKRKVASPNRLKSAGVGPG